MTVGYNCTDPRDGCTGGYKDDCDVSESGERICPDCGKAVLGLTEEPKGGKLFPPYHRFRIGYGFRSDRTVTVEATSYREAFERAEGKGPDYPIKTVTPVV